MPTHYPKRKRAPIDYAAVAADEAQALLPPPPQQRAAKRQATRLAHRPLDTPAPTVEDLLRLDPDLRPAPSSATASLLSALRGRRWPSSSDTASEQEHRARERREQRNYAPSSSSELWDSDLPDPADDSSSEILASLNPEAGLANRPSPAPSDPLADGNYTLADDPLTTLTVQEVLDLVGTVVYFVRSVKKVRIDLTSPLSVTRALNSRDGVWDDQSIDWTKYVDRAWRHRFDAVDSLYEMPLGHVAALVDVVMQFKYELGDKGIAIIL
ncbi:hypothetical protein F4781DRAFT_321568 [Annulohypoxylon bovei var. microspora]|nr:hypothetical protein F4781DRAFT_321568 [Annulohypoxylon bovei var. microspora]